MNQNNNKDTRDKSIHPFLNILKMISVITGGIILLIILSIVIITRVYKENIMQYAIREINQQLKVPLNIRKIDLAFWRTFPNISLEFDDVVIKSPISTIPEPGQLFNGDTLLKAERIYLQMNPLKLLFGTYKINKLSVHEGFIRVIITENGASNFDILKKKVNSTNGTEEFNFNDVLLSNMTFMCYDKQDQVNFSGYADKLKFSGDLQADIFWFKTEAVLWFNKMEVRGYTYMTNKHVTIASSITGNQDLYHMAFVKMNIEGLDLNGSGAINRNPEPWIDFKVEGNKLNLQKAANVLPESLTLKFKGYSPRGTMSLRCTIQGSLGKGHSPSVHFSFNLNHAAIQEKISGIKISDVTLKGSYVAFSSTRNRPDELKVDTLYAKLGSGIIRGRIQIQNLSEPIINIRLYSKLNLNDIKLFCKVDTMDVMKGWAEGAISIAGTLPKSSLIRLTDFSNLNYTGSILIKDGFFKIKNMEESFNSMNGEVILQNDLFCKNLTFRLDNNDFKVNGTLTNGIHYLLRRNEKAFLIAEIISRNLDLSNYFVSAPENHPSKSTGSRQLLFPENLSLDVKLSVDNFKLHKFNAKRVACNLIYKPTLFTIKSLTLESMTGHIAGNGLILQDVDKNFITKGQFDLYRVDIQEMFYVFNNFSQDIITDHNLRGNLSGAISVSSQWNHALVLNDNLLLVDGDLTIEDGQLIDFEYVKGLSRFISMDELKSIQFNTLKNRITVKENRITIPQMDIYTSAFNIKASGIHYFDNHYSYKVKILLSDILWNKAKKHKKENEEFGVVEESELGKTTIPLSISGYKSEYKISYDSKEAFNMFKSSLNNQRTELKDIFHKEFGWYKNDSCVKQNTVQKNNPIRVQWDEDKPVQDTMTQTIPPVKKKNKKKDDIQVEWDDK